MKFLRYLTLFLAIVCGIGAHSAWYWAEAIRFQNTTHKTPGDALDDSEAYGNIKFLKKETT